MRLISPRNAKFHVQKSGAKRRGIAWNLSFSEWCTIWDDSGHWDQRGCGPGTYAMCRKGDLGPYAVGNVFVALNSQNCSSAHKVSDLPIGVAVCGPSFQARRCINGKLKYLGTYPTPELAHVAYLAGKNLMPCAT